MDIIQSASPNYSYSNYDKNVLVLHKTLGLMPHTLAWLRNPDSQVSCQYLITKTGDIHQLVKNRDMAWHAGRIHEPSERAKRVMQKTNWGSYVNPNKYTIGIENEALINDEPTEEQLAANVWLYNYLKGISSVAFDGNEDNFITHKDLTSYKPDLESWRDAILNSVLVPEEECVLTLDSWSQLGIKVEGKKIIMYKKK